MTKHPNLEGFRGFQSSPILFLLRRWAARRTNSGSVATRTWISYRRSTRSLRNSAAASEQNSCICVAVLRRKPARNPWRNSWDVCCTMTPVSCCWGNWWCDWDASTFWGGCVKPPEMRWRGLCRAGILCRNSGKTCCKTLIIFFYSGVI